MKIEYQITFADYKEANLAHQTARSTVQKLFLIAILLVMAGIDLWMAFRPISRTASVPTTGPILLEDALSTLAPWLCWLLMMLIVVIVARHRSIAARRSFTRVSGTTPRFFSAAWLIIIGIVLTASTMIIDNIRQQSDSSFIWYVWLVVIFVVVFAVFRGAYKRHWKLQPSLARPRSLEYSPEAVTTDDGITLVMHRWPAFLRCVETKGLFLLYPSGIGFVMVPKRAFPSPEAIDGFRRLIEEWADGQSMGFPVIQRAS